MDKYAVILAAGKGTRMKSKTHKVLHSVCGKALISHVVDVVNAIGVSQIVTVVGHFAEDVKAKLGDTVTYAVQNEQLGTAHAVAQSAEVLQDKFGVTIVICGDTPLLTQSTIQKLIDTHLKEQATVTVLTSVASNPTGYGRIVRDESGNLLGIVEHKDCSPKEILINEINVATYCFDTQFLFSALGQISNNNSQGEYYLTDIISVAHKEKKGVATFCTDDFLETLGINDRVQLAQAEKEMQRRINERHMQSGVTIIDPCTTYIDADVIIGEDTVILPGTMLAGESVIGEGCRLGPHSEIINSRIGDRSVVKQSCVVKSTLGCGVNVGPFTNIRPEASIGNNVKLGNFVEVKKSVIGEGSKVSHLSYIGDAKMGRDVNVGCGTITVNFDGKSKHVTQIEDRAFVGCNVNLIAPLVVGENALVAAGSTVTKSVPADSLAIERSSMVVKEGYRKNKSK